MNSLDLRPVLLSLLAPVLLGACSPKLPTESPIIDVRPTKLQRDELLVVEGERFLSASNQSLSLRPAPAFRAKGVITEVILDGTFTSAGGLPIARTIVLPAFAAPAGKDSAWSERVLAPIDGDAERQIGRAQFRGKLGVRQRATGTAANLAPDPITTWTGERAPLELTFFAPSMQNLATQLVDWLTTDRLLVWLGISVRSTGRGLEITTASSPTPCSPAKGVAAGLQPGDLLLAASGAPLRSRGDLTLAFRRERATAVMLKVQRAGREVSFSVPTATRPLLLPVSVIYLAVMAVFAVVVLVVCLVIAGTLTWVERRVAGKMQSRVGPNRVGPLGALQWVADGIKLVLKEDIIPDAVDKPLFKLAPYLVFVGLFGTFVVLPFGQFLIVSDLNVGLLYLVAITGFVSLGLMMAGWSSNNKWALLGGMRSAAQIISYEIPSGLALMVPVVLAGTLSTQSLVEHQGGWPWQWAIFDNPFVFICFFIYFISALAEGNRTPFDLPEAESELVAGYNIEYSGWRFAVFFLSEWANLFVVGAVATTVFLGGWQVPGVDLALHASHWGWQLLGLCLFFAKAMALVFVIIWIRWTLPRFRVDQMMRLCWKYFVPWTFAAVVFQALWVWVAPEMLRTVVKWGTCVVCGGGLCVLFFSRVIHNWRQNPEKWSWNPFP
jgi:NADH-quinone oxidoreductase subunit H